MTSSWWCWQPIAQVTARSADCVSRCRRATVKGRYTLKRDDLVNSLDGCLIVWFPRVSLPQRQEDGRWLRERFSGRVWIGVELLTGGCDTRRLESTRDAW